MPAFCMPIPIPKSASHFCIWLTRRPQRAAAGSVRSEHWKRSTKNLRAAQKPILPPELTCERRIDPAEPPTASRPIARTTAQNPTKNPETSQRNRIQRLKASHPSHTTRPAGGRGIGPERALEAIHKKPARSAMADPPPSFPASVGSVPQSHPPNGQPLNPPDFSDAPWLP